MLPVGLGSPEGAEASDTLLECVAAAPPPGEAAAVGAFTPLMLVFLRDPLVDSDWDALCLLLLLSAPLAALG